MWELLQSTLIPVIIVILLLKFFGGNAAGPSLPAGSKFEMELIADSQLIKRDKREKKAAKEVFAENDIVLFYFSAHWCPPCRKFTPKLAAVYNDLKKDGKKIEVIFLSSDKTEEAMLSYMSDSHGDWFATEFGASVEKKVSQHFGVRGIPTLIVLSGSGKVVSVDGRGDVEEHGAKAWEKWTGSAE